jgi:uncharacterized integral membrane protein (TIGR00697 family)
MVNAHNESPATLLAMTPNRPPDLAADGRQQRLQLLFLVLAGFFLGNALLAEMIGGKLFQVPAPWRSLVAEASVWHHFTLSCGVILWPIVFITTDVINEYFGRAGVRRLSLLGAGIIAYSFVALWLAGLVRAAGFSPVDDASFQRVFLQSQWIIVGSIAAFLVAQLIDASVFWLIRRRTGHRLLWLRATGSTLVSQLIDTFLVAFVGLYLPSRLGFSQVAQPFTFLDYLNTSSSGYLFKLAVAIGVTPLLYLLHTVIDRYLGPEESERVIEAAAAAEHADDKTVLASEP